jgi:hypothetical protein
MVFDTQGAHCLLFGGADALVERSDTWEYDARGWRQRITRGTPAAVSSMGMAYDATRGTVVVVGGFNGVGAPTATWELGGIGGTFALYGTGCLGSNNLSPRLRPMTVPDLGATAQLDVTDLPGSSGFVYLGGGLSDTTLGSLPLPLDLTSIGLTGCRAYMSNDVGVVLAHTAGTASWSLPVPNNAALVGFRMFLQALSLDPVVARPFPGAMSGGAEFLVR